MAVSATFWRFRIFPQERVKLVWRFDDARNINITRQLSATQVYFSLLMVATGSFIPSYSVKFLYSVTNRSLHLLPVQVMYTQRLRNERALQLNERRFMAPDHVRLSQLQLTGILAVVCNTVHANLHRECVGSVSITEFAFTTTALRSLLVTE